MFKLNPNPEFTHVVPVLVPIDGGHREEKLKATFRVMSDHEAAELSELDMGKAFLRRAVVSIADVVDADGAAIPFSDEMREQLIAIPYVRGALARAYFGAMHKALAGN